MPSPWVLLGGLLGAIALVVSTWIYKGNIDAVAKDDAIKSMQVKADADHAKALHEEQAKTAAAEAQGKRNDYAYQANLDKLNRDLVTAHDTHNQLLNAIAVYADYAPGGRAAQATAVSLSEANQRIDGLAHLLPVVVAAGERMAAAASACAVKLTAAEGWADAVEKEFDVASDLLRHPADQPAGVAGVPASPLSAPSNLLGDHPFTGDTGPPGQH